VRFALESLPPRSWTLAATSVQRNIIPMTMVPDQIMDAIHFAKFIMAKEKKDIGSIVDTVYPMKFFLFHGEKDILGLMGARFITPPRTTRT
jgi:hypothetical protein